MHQENFGNDEGTPPWRRLPNRQRRNLVDQFWKRLFSAEYGDYKRNADRGDVIHGSQEYLN
ncbi:MAG: hypothetical protein AUG75_08180 [Cyanobacteria bacterium 13_1_20CM_4_61_6]|nr:MAG: hypothetical protein AUG75_08180 [Cyanobacteria bacterium 13_1_20CM_4_61_6]